MTFPLSDQIGDTVQTQLNADATTKTVSWIRGEINIDDPMQIPATDSYGDMVLLGSIIVFETSMKPKLMGGSAKTAWLGNVPVQITVVARSEERDTQAARRQCEDMLTNVFRVLLGGDVTLGGLVMHVDEASARTDGIPNQGVGWATTLIIYRYLSAPT